MEKGARKRKDKRTMRPNSNKGHDTNADAGIETRLMRREDETGEGWLAQRHCRMHPFPGWCGRRRPLTELPQP